MEDLIQELIGVFLKINPKPADAQVHALAQSLGVDKEVLEAQMFSMLADDEDLLVDAEEVEAGFEIGADSIDILDDPTANPDQMDLSEVSMTDGDPTDDDLGLQEETLDDGFDVQDVGTGTSPAHQDVLKDDGVLDLSLDD